MILYHGSNVEVVKPDLSKSKPFKDFGQGFYLSADKEQARRMAEQKTLQLMCGQAVVSEFDFDETWLQSDELKVKIFNDYSVEWANFILKNRDFRSHHPAHDYDIVFGPIADDGVALQIGLFRDGLIDLSSLAKALEYKKLNKQINFGTQKAIDLLKRL